MPHRHSRAGKVHRKDAANRWTLNPNSIRRCVHAAAEFPLTVEAWSAPISRHLSAPCGARVKSARVFLKSAVVRAGKAVT
jgi:hypothetical protein